MPLYWFAKSDDRRAISLAQEIVLSDVEVSFEGPLDAELVHFRFRRVETVFDFEDYDVVSVTVVGQWEEPGGANPFPGRLQFQLQRFKVFADASRIAAGRVLPNHSKRDPCAGKNIRAAKKKGRDDHVVERTHPDTRFGRGHAHSLSRLEAC